MYIYIYACIYVYNTHTHTHTHTHYIHTHSTYHPNCEGAQSSSAPSFKATAGGGRVSSPTGT